MEAILATKTKSDGGDSALDVAAAASLGAVAPPPGGEMVGVDKIRDLLFGNQMQDYERRFTALEQRFLQRFKEIEAETARSLGAFEANAKKQVDSVAGQLRDEKDQRADADKEIERAMREHDQALEKHVRLISDQLGEFRRETADLVSHTAQTLRDEIKRRNEDTQQAMEKLFTELSGVKTDRSLLAGLFIEVAKALSQDVASRRAGNGVETARGLSAG
jgi:hypothetical protein